MTQTSPRRAPASWRIRCAAALLGALGAAGALGAEGAREHGKFRFGDWRGPALRVFYATPAKLSAETPLLFVMTGRQRNAGHYRDQWQPLAKRYGFVVLVPEFSAADFPGEAAYDAGGVFQMASDAVTPVKRLRRRDEAKWAFSALEPLFDHAKQRFGLDAADYALYGHSSGAGFVHRYVYYKPDARLSRAVAANGAWYLLPRGDADYPYGLRGAGLTRAHLLRAFRRPLTIMIAQQDLGPRKQYLANTPQAQQQGPHVVSRGMNFLLLAAVAAQREKLRLNWSLVSVPNVGHSNKAMAPQAIRHLFPKLAAGRRAGAR